MRASLAKVTTVTLFAHLAFLVSLSSAEITTKYACTAQFDFITGAQYTPTVLNGACIDQQSPVAYALHMESIWCGPLQCRRICDRNRCVGYFFQKTKSGHAVCGLYTSSAALRKSRTRNWIKQRHSQSGFRSQVCVVSTLAHTIPTPKVARPVPTVVYIQLVIPRNSAAQEVSAFEGAVGATVATFGDPSWRAEDISVSIMDVSSAGQNVTIEVHVADLVLGTELASDMQVSVDSGAFANVLAANGAMGLLADAPIQFGEVKLEPQTAQGVTRFQRGVEPLIVMMVIPMLLVVVVCRRTNTREVSIPDDEESEAEGVASDESTVIATGGDVVQYAQVSPWEVRGEEVAGTGLEMLSVEYELQRGWRRA